MKLLDIKANKIECGTEHVLFLTADRELYTWGANDCGQLGINKRLSQKIIEFYSFQNEDKQTGNPVLRQMSYDSSKNNESNKQDGSEEIENEDNPEKKEQAPMNYKNRNDDEQKAMVQVLKTCNKNFIGVPSKLSSILGKVENIDCGDSNSFAIVKI